MAVGVSIGNKAGPRISTLIGILLMCAAYGILVFFDEYIIVLIAMGVFGMGDGIANLSVIKNCWKYFPQHTGLVNGIIIGGLGISSAVLTPIADYIIINPKKVGPEEKDFYPERVALNLLDYLYFLLILFLVLGIVAVSLTIKFEKEPTSADVVFGKAAELEAEGRSGSTISIKTQSNLRLLCEGFFSCKNLMLSVFCFCGPCK